MERFTEFGGPVHKRPVEDLAFAVTRFIQKGGSLVNYYMVCTDFHCSVQDPEQLDILNIIIF